MFFKRISIFLKKKINKIKNKPNITSSLFVYVNQKF